MSSEMSKLIEKIAEDLSEFIRIPEIKEMDGGSLQNTPFYWIRRNDSTRNNFGLLLKTDNTEFEFEGDADTILDRMKELFLEDEANE